MIVLDTDILTLALAAHPRVAQRIMAASEIPVTSIVSRIEVLQGRFDSVLKASSAEELLRAQNRLVTAEHALAKFTIVAFDVGAADKFGRLRQDKKLKKMGRNDLLIACIALANRALLVTRNVKDFHAAPGLKVENWAD